MGRGQKLCSVEILISPAATASRIPGTSPTRVPWLSSAYSKPRSRISRNMARPSVWRWEFQQVEEEYNLHVRVAGTQHRRKAGGLFLPAPAFARLFEMSVGASD